MNYPITLKDGEEWPIQWIKEMFTDGEIAAGEKRFDIVPIGPCGVRSISGMAFEPIHGTTRPGDQYDPVIAWKIWGMRTMHRCRSLGYDMEGRVSIQGRNRRAFTSSKLFRYYDHFVGGYRLFNCAILYICKH